MSEKFGLKKRTFASFEKKKKNDIHLCISEKFALLRKTESIVGI